MQNARGQLRRISMSLDSDVIVDRRRMRRKLTFWRVAAVLVAIAAIVTVGVVATPGGRSALTTSGSIARVHIDGLIRSDNDRVEALERLEKSRAAAVVVHINSPGGTTAGSEQLYDALVKDSYAWFRGLVKERRGMDDALLEKVADGRVFTGRQAVDLKLVDQVGDEKTAVAWLVAQKGVKSDLPVRDYKLSPKFGDLTFLRTAASITLDAFGLSAIARQIEQAGVAQAVDRLSLDGMLALWHPAGAN